MVPIALRRFVGMSGPPGALPLRMPAGAPGYTRRSARRLTRPAVPLAALLTALLLGLGAANAQAQTVTINGFVDDQANGLPMELVNVVLLAGDSLVTGTVTDRDGLYLLTRVGFGRYLLQASFIGYETFSDSLIINSEGTRTIHITMVPDEAALGEVVVQTERQSGAARVTAGQQTVRPADIELIPAPDLSGDLAAYLSTLPGVVSVGDRGGQLFIRGGEPSQNLVLLDGMLLYQPFHILGFYSAFPSDILSRTDIYAGGYGARFGERISSVIDVWTRNGNQRRFAGSASISPFIGTLRLEGPVVPDRVSFLVSARQSMIERGAEPILNERLPFHFDDFYAKLHADLTGRSRLSVSRLVTHDRGTLADERAGTPAEEVRWANRGFSVRYLLLPRTLSISMDLRLTHSALHTELGATDAPSRSSTISNTSITLDGTFTSEDMNSDAGLAIRFISSETELGGLYQNTEFKGVGIDHFAFYYEPEFIFGNLRVRTGARLQWYYLRIDPYIEPRLRVVWDLGRQAVSAAAGFYQQEIIGLNDRRDAASVFTAWTNIPKFNPGQPDILAERIPRAIHAILGYRANPTDWFEVSIEGFHKWLDNLFIAEWTAFPRFTTRLQPATGRATGFDARLEVRRPPFYGHINYGLSSTRYAAKQASLQLWYGVEELRFRPPHDRRHQVNVLLSTRVWGFDLSARWEFGSGLPFSRPIGFDGFVLVDDVIDVTEAPYTRRVIYEDPYNAVLPTYHRLDVSVDRTFTFGPTSVTVLGSIINVYDRRNLFYLDVFTLRRVDQLPLIPSFGLKIAFE